MHSLKCPGKISMEKLRVIEVKLELVEFWINQLTILQIGPIKNSRLSEKEKLLDTMLSIMAVDLLPKE